MCSRMVGKGANEESVTLEDEIVFKHVMEKLLKSIVHIWNPKNIHLVLLAV